MLADDFLRAIALDPLRARVPARDPAFRRQHVNGVVGDALNQKPELFLALPERVLGLFSLGKIARDLGIADQIAGGVLDGVDDDIGPELSAVLSAAPAFAFEFSFARGNLERSLRQPRFAIGLGIEAREMLAQDFGFLVAFEAPRPRIPARDGAVQIEHVDGVIGDRLHEHAVAAIVRQ